MKKYLLIRHLSRCIATLGAAAVCFFAFGCGCKAKSAGPADPSFSDTVHEEALDSLTRIIADGDAEGFAGMCSYPIQRRYPLRNVEDSATMVDYFPVMADDSLRAIAAKAKHRDWEKRGWRGWALGRPVLIWFDYGVQFVDYESKAETGMRRILARDEMRSLQPPLGDGWQPVETLVEAGGEKVFRIDSAGGVYRLMAYPDRGGIREMPVLLLTGPLRTEGSAESRIYNFSDSTGTTAIYMPDSEDPVCIMIERPGKISESLPVKRAYWRDLLH